MRFLAHAFITGILLLPVIIVFSYIFAPSNETWQHLVDYQLFSYAKNTILLMFGSGLLSLIFGFLSAWLTTAYRFPLSNVLEWALVLPLAFPAYIAAYMYGGILGTEGSFTAWVSKTFHLSYNELWFLDIMSLPGAIFVIASVLYPYVYLSIKATLKQMSQSNIDAARAFGYSPVAIFFKVILPAQRLGIVAGVSLVMMEAMSDYGVVSYFGVSTFVAGIFRTWFSVGDLTQATKLASILMLFVFVLFSLEIYQRRAKKYSAFSKGFKPIQKIKLKGFNAYFVLFLCSLPFLFGFLIPFYRMLSWFLISFSDTINQAYIQLCLNTFKLALIATLSTTIFGFSLVYLSYYFKSKISLVIKQLSKVGYAVPGAVIGVGILVLYSFVVKIGEIFDIAHMLVGGSIILLIYGYSVRFLAVSTSVFENGYEQMSKNYKDAGKIFGYSNMQILRKIDLPLLKSAFGSSLIVVFVEVLKELPLTLILSPFNFESLSTKTLEFSTQEMIVQTSVPALLIVAISLIPVIILIKTTMR